jgi:hypothetical protein
MTVIDRRSPASARPANGRLRRNLAVHERVDEGRVAALLRTSIIAACTTYALALPESMLDGGEGWRHATHFWVRLSVTSEVLSAGLAEFNKELEPAALHVVQHLVHGTIGPKVGLNDRVECPLGSGDDRSGGYEPYPSEQSKKPGQVRGVVFLVTQRVPVEASGLVNEFSIERLPLGLDSFMVREKKLRPLRQPRASKRCQPANCRSSQGR